MSGNITPANFAGTPEDMALVKKNIVKSDWYGRIVSTDFTAVLVAATLQERDADTGERFDLREVGKALEAIRTSTKPTRPRSNSSASPRPVPTSPKVRPAC